MDRHGAAFVLACFSVFFGSAACGDASTPRIDGPPGAHGSDTTGSGNGAGPAAPDAGPDATPSNPQGALCSAPNQVCGGVCIAVESDPSNCGACGNACLGDDATCIAGSCACGGANFDYCDGVGCMDVSSDFNNCGACGYQCDPNNDQDCENGQCIPNDP